MWRCPQGWYFFRKPADKKVHVKPVLPELDYENKYHWAAFGSGEDGKMLSDNGWDYMSTRGIINIWRKRRKQ